MRCSHSPSMRSLSRSRSRSPSNWKRERERDRDRRNRFSDRGDPKRNIVSTRRVYISNIPFETKWKEIKDIFREKVGEVTFVELFESPDGKPNGAGTVEFKDIENAQKAIDVMHKYNLKGRAIIVREERERDRIRNQAVINGLGMMGDGPPPSSGMMGPGPGGPCPMGPGPSPPNPSILGPGGVNPQILNQLGIEGPLTNQVFVANLDYKVTWKKLKDIFRMAGNVVRVDIKEDKNGKSRGMAVVQFELPLEAVQAISMFNNQVLYDRPMTCRMDKMSDGGPMGDLPPVRPPSPKLPSGLRGVGMGLGMNGQAININQMADMGMGSGSGMGMGLGNSGMNIGSMGMGGGMSSGMGGMNSSMGIPNGLGMRSGMSDMGNGMNNMGLGMGMNAMNNMSSMGSSNMNSGMGRLGGSGMVGSSNMMGGGGMMGNGLMGSGADMMNSGSGMMGGGSGSSSSGMMGGGAPNVMGGSQGMMNNGSSSGLSSSGMSNMMSLGSNRMTEMLGIESNMMGNSSMSSMMNSNMSDRRISSSGSNLMMDECTSVYIKNLPYSYTWKNLRDRFSDIGDVKYAAIKMENNKSKGIGLVRFASHEQARTAVNIMNGFRLDGRELEVRLERNIN